ncbi:MAG: hypothetical protein QOF62_3884 [Pyrinomonadaceae bacterium]|jgi:hypothetical protein|nr:hypothetical protein [Pyrinomonadaceae bacterium]
MRIRNVTLLAALLVIALNNSNSQAQVGPVEEHLPRKADTTLQRLDQMHLPSEPVSLGPPEAKPIRLNPNVSVSLALSPDGALQSSPGSAHPVTIGLNKEGIGNGFPNFQVQNAPPDTSGAVGRTQFVQWVNTSFAIFDKATGNRLLGPIKGKFLWQGLGGSPTTKVPCEETNDGDPIVSYDRVANRWVLSQFSVNGGVFAQCIAVSETSDALGKYHRYEYESPAFNDYPHMGVWRDAYYFSYNMFEGLSGSRACAYERRKMLIGNPGAKEQCIQLQPQFFGIQPSDTDGRKFAAVGRPNYFVGLGTAPNTLLLWKFHVDFANKNNTTMGVGPTRQPDAVIPVARYNLACSGTGGTCLPQPGTSRQLDSLGERLMFRLAYRKFPTTESLVLNHSVDIGPPTGRTAVRWYEIRNPNAPQPTIFQQGTFSPDATHRWMGSIAMDKMGNIAVAYNITGNGQKPGVAFTARAPNDPPGIMGVETVIKAGGGIQDTSSTHLSRWGDYSGLTVDPVDDCTFWFTTEFQGTNGVFNWRTSIAKFKLNSCH